MQIIGLPGQFIRGARLASRWMQGRADGPTADQAARIVGVSPATLYRWQRQPLPGPRRPPLRRVGLKPMFTSADASVMPSIAAGNTNAPSIMTGENCAAMVLGDAE